MMLLTAATAWAADYEFRPTIIYDGVDASDVTFSLTVGAITDHPLTSGQNFNVGVNEVFSRPTNFTITCSNPKGLDLLVTYSGMVYFAIAVERDISFTTNDAGGCTFSISHYSGSSSNRYIAVTITVVGNINSSYDVNLPTGLTGGSIISDKTNPVTTNETVTLTAVSGSGYLPTNISATRHNEGQAVDVDWDGSFDNSATFSMPNDDVDVSASFTNVWTAAGGLFAKIPKNKDTRSVTIPDGVSSFKVYGPTGSSAKTSYSFLENGTLLLTVPELYVVKLTGNILANGQFSILVYDGNSTSSTQIGQYHGSVSGYNAALPDTVVSTGNTMLIITRSSSNDISAGLDLTATIIPNPAHFSQDGNTYTIHTATGWDVFCDMLDGGEAFSGKTVVLDENIEVTRMAGGAGHDFRGMFDGQGHTLTVTYGSAGSPIADDKAAPFRNVEGGCAIKDLHVCGDIYASAKYAGGLVGTQYGTVTILNCHVSTVIHSYTSGDGTHGGIVGHNGNSSGAKLSIEGCVFDGKLLICGTTATTDCAGFVGYKHNSGTVNIANSLYAPATIPDGENEIASGATFVRNGESSNITNCYYTAALGAPQGKQLRSITAGDYVTVANAGTPKTVYNVSGITAYPTGIMVDSVLYAGNGDEVALTLGYSGHNNTFIGFETSAGTLNGSENPYTLTMPDEDVVVTAAFEQEHVIGDLNGDGVVDVADVNICINVILERVTDPAIKALADLNGDGTVDVADVNMIINIILSN